MAGKLVTVNIFNIVWNDEEFYKMTDDMILDLPKHLNDVVVEVKDTEVGDFDDLVQKKISEYLSDNYMIDVEEYDWEVVCEDEMEG